MYRCVALINRQALLHNLKNLKDHSANAHIIVMVKANAYGHGLKEVASILRDQLDISFGVATIDEAVILRNAQAKNPILLFDGGASANEPDALVDYDVIPMISERRSLKLLEDCLKKRGLSHRKKVHLKIDTGFTRLGLDYRDLLSGKHDDFFQELKNNPRFALEGIATHFCSADLINDAFSDEQIVNFKHCLNYLSNQGLRYTSVHMANSAAILRKKFNIEESDKRLMIRPGLASFGINPLSKSEGFAWLKPVMSIKAQVIAIKKISLGQGIGYGHSYIAKEPRTIAIIAIGYGDGLRRSLSNRAHFLCRGLKSPIVGTISMDSSAIDVTDVVKKWGEASVNLGDFVTVMGHDGDEIIDARTLAELDGTIPYEILTSIAERLSRQIV